MRSYFDEYTFVDYEIFLKEKVCLKFILKEISSESFGCKEIILMITSTMRFLGSRNDYAISFQIQGSLGPCLIRGAKLPTRYRYKT